MTVLLAGLMLNQVKVSRVMPPPKHAYGLAMNIWCVWALRRNLGNMFTMSVSVPTFQISVNNTNFSLSHFVKIFTFFPRDSRVSFMLYDNPFTIPLENFAYHCELPFWGSLDEPPKAESSLS